MASIHLTEAGTYAVSYYVEGLQRKKTFKSKKEAKNFVALITLSPEKRKSEATAAQILTVYREEVSAKKKGYKSEFLRIGRFLRAPWAEKRVDDIKTKEIQSWFAERVHDKGARAGATLGAGTIIREAENLKAVFSWGVKQGFCSVNPAKDIVLPKKPEHRERVASDEDIQALLVACGWDGVSPVEDVTQFTICAFLLSCKTGMRSGEILKLEDTWIEGQVIHIPHGSTKTEYRRNVALSTDALRLIEIARGYSKNNLIFGSVLSEGTRDTLFRKVRDRACLKEVVDSKGRVVKEGLNFHDGRATFCTWAASPNPKTGAPRLDVMSLARQTGHRDLRKLMVYYRATAEQIAKRLG